MPIATCRICGFQADEADDVWNRRGSSIDRCKPCWNRHQREYRVANRDRLNEQDRKRRQSDPEAFRASRRDHYHRNREKMQQEKREIYAADPNKFCERERERRAADPGKKRAQEKAKRERNLDVYRERGRLHRERNRNMLNLRGRQARQADPDKFREQDRARRLADPEAFRARQRARRAKNPIRFAVGTAISNHLRARKMTKGKSFRDIVDWSMQGLHDHLESLFEPGMSFDNYGEWHIDHIIPITLVEFDSPNDPRFRAAWALNNLAPLWASDNCSKSASLDWQLPDTYTNPLLRAMYDNRDLSLVKSLIC